MGVSTDGILYFGFDFYDADDAPEDHWNPGEEDWEERYAEAHGCVDDSGLFNEHGEYAFAKDSPEFLAARAKRDKYYDKKRAILNACPCKIDDHCSNEYPIYFVTLKAKSAKAWRGKHVEITPELLTVTENEVNQLKEFCKDMGIEWQEPKWYLASYWG